jgi:S-layer protein
VDTYFVNAADANKRPTGGDDWFRSVGAGELNSVDVIEGGAGNDRLTAEIVEGAAGTAVTVRPALTSIETLTVTVTDNGSANSVADAVTLNLADSTGTTAVNITQGNNVATVVSGISTAVAVTVSGGGAANTATVTYTGLSTATGGGNDAATVALGSNADLATLTVAGIEILTLNATSTASGTVDIDTLTAAALERLVITGSGNIDLGGATAITGAGLDTGEVFNLDASASTGAVVIVTGTGNLVATAGSGGLSLTTGTIAADSGATTITGGAGKDSITVAQATNGAGATGVVSVVTVNGGAGNDTIDVSAVANPTDLSATTDDESITVNLVVDGGEGNDTISVNTGNVSVTGGAGDDRISVVAAAINKYDAVSGGEGTDTLAVTSADAGTIAGSATARATLSGFERVAITNALAAGFDASRFGVNSIVIEGDVSDGAGTNPSALTGLTSGATITLTSAVAAADVVQTDVLTVTLTGATAAGANSDVLNVVYAGDVDDAAVTGGAGSFELQSKIDIIGVDILNVSASDALGTAAGAADSQANDGLAVALTGDTSLKTINVSGSRAVTVTSTTATQLATYDASAATGNTTFNASGISVTNAITMTGGAGVDALTGTSLADVITGGAGADVLNGAGGADTISGGAGNDAITGGTGVDTLTGDAGIDTFVVAAGDAGTTGGEKVTDFALGTGGDVLDISTTTLIANVTASSPVNVVSAISSAAAGDTLTATVTDGVITLSGNAVAKIDTVAEAIAVFNLLDANNTAEVGAIVIGSNTYVITDAASGAAGTADTVNDVIQLVGVTSAVALGTAVAANTILIA